MWAKMSILWKRNKYIQSLIYFVRIDTSLHEMWWEIHFKQNISTLVSLLRIRQSDIRVSVLVFNTTFNNISIILVEETGIPRENHWSAASHGKLYHIMLYRVHLTWAGFELTKLVVIGTDCILIVNPTTIWSRPWQPL